MNEQMCIESTQCSYGTVNGVVSLINHQQRDHECSKGSDEDCKYPPATDPVIEQKDYQDACVSTEVKVTSDIIWNEQTWETRITPNVSRWISKEEDLLTCCSEPVEYN